MSTGKESIGFIGVGLMGQGMRAIWSTRASP
jgi:3-hydroxyisobutyrate dehydrogenase-like beta-hydroxyacid dehydrogenase